jgi:hypothetical protein
LAVFSDVFQAFVSDWFFRDGRFRWVRFSGYDAITRWRRQRNVWLLLWAARHVCSRNTHVELVSPLRHHQSSAINLCTIGWLKKK